MATGSFSAAGRRDHHEGALQRCSTDAVGSSVQLPLHEAGQVMKSRDIDEWSACRIHQSWLVLVCILTAVIKSLTAHYIHSVGSWCSQWPFGLGTLCPSQGLNHVTTYASCVTMQMCAHVCIIRKLIWIFFEFIITMLLTIPVAAGLISFFL